MNPGIFFILNNIQNSTSKRRVSAIVDSGFLEAKRTIALLWGKKHVRQMQTCFPPLEKVAHVPIGKTKLFENAWESQLSQF